MSIEEDGYKKVQLGPKGFSVPKNWTVQKVKETCENLDRKRVPIKESNRTDGDIPYYGATGCIDYVGDYIFDEELVLVGEDGADWSEFAKTSYIVDGKSWVNNHAHVLRALDIEPKYFSELINMMNLNYAIVGTNRGKLNKKHLMNLEVLSPPPEEQKKISEVLSTVDEAIQKTEEIIKRTKELKKGLMQDLLTKGIGHEEFKEVQLGPREIDIPSRWEVKNLKSLSTSKPSYGANASSVEYSTQLPRYIRITDISEEGYLKDDEKKSIPLGDAKGHYLQPGDIVFARSGATVGKTYLQKDDGEYVYAGYLIKFELDSSKVIPEFVFYVTHSHYYYSWVKSKIRATSQPNINAQEYASFKILLPSISEQKKIVNILSTVDQKIIKEKTYKEKLEDLKKGLMQDLLTGKVRVLSLLSEEEKEELKEADVTG